MKSSRIGPPLIAATQRAARFRAATASIVAHAPAGALAPLSSSRIESGAAKTPPMDRSEH